MNTIYKRITLFFIPLLLVSACSKAPSLPTLTHQALTEVALQPAELAGLRIQSLFVVLFEKDFDTETWTHIFTQTNALSLNQKRLRELSGLNTAEVQTERGDLIGKNSTLLTDLGNLSAFMMNWTIENENCKISKSTLKVACKPFNADSPLNGGLPTQVGSLEWVTPDPVRDDIKSPYLKIVLEQNKPAPAKNLKLTLRLKLETKNEKEVWFKGDTLPEGGSFYPYGYAEMTLVH